MGPKVMIKAQVLVGGRGKAGGIKPANSLEEAKKIASSLLHSNLKGLEVKRLLFEEQLDIAREYYAGIVTDRERACPLAMVSMKGGMDIEEVAKQSPDQVAFLPIDVLFRAARTPRYVRLPFSSDFRRRISIRSQRF